MNLSTSTSDSHTPGDSAEEEQLPFDGDFETELAPSLEQIEMTETEGERSALMPSLETRSFQTDRAPGPSPGRHSAQWIGPYRLLRVLGEGGLGKVYLAEQQSPIRRRLALKLIRPGILGKEALARFDAERQALALLHHEHIAKIYDAGLSRDGQPFFAMELVTGVPITTHCDRRRADIRQRLRLFLQVCAGVQHAHEQAIAHRDLKPSNVLIADTDSGPVAKIIDFGLAKGIGRKLTDLTLHTQVGQMIGTPAYMSPEQAGTGKSVIDARTDVYSLGVMLYELLTGTYPFKVEEWRKASWMEIQRRIHEEEPIHPATRLSQLGERAKEVAARRQTSTSSLARAVRGELEWILMKALEKDPARRYQTAGDLANDIRRYLDEKPVLAGPPSTTYRLRTYCRRHSKVLFAASVLMIAIWGSLSLDRSDRGGTPGRLEVSDIFVGRDGKTPVTSVDFRVHNSGGTQVLINKVSFELLSALMYPVCDVMQFSGSYDCDIGGLKRVGDTASARLSQRLKPGEVDRFQVRLTNHRADPARGWMRLRPTLFTSHGEVTCKPIDVWQPSPRRVDEFAKSAVRGLKRRLEWAKVTSQEVYFVWEEAMGVCDLLLSNEMLTGEPLQSLKGTEEALAHLESEKKTDRATLEPLVDSLADIVGLPSDRGL